MRKFKQLRKRIEKIDKDIIGLLAARSNTSKIIGQIKKDKDLKIRDKQREKQLALLHKQTSRVKKIEPAMVKQIFDIVIRHSRKVQKP